MVRACLDAIYDPASCSCAWRHFPPAMAYPDGRIKILDLPEGPLGLAGLRFQADERQLPKDTQLVLYTDGHIENRPRDIMAGLKQVCDAPERPRRRHAPSPGRMNRRASGSVGPYSTTITNRSDRPHAVNLHIAGGW
ncbi:SpoIIE family protein phosphatase [Streptomyces sp. NPDC002573]|uniref:SpoIIE family protein phosphatase n=1 Tax=Streptomyces sp. NPDC002573 TaxID=3364651 RepID=UPI0036B1580C